MFCVQCISCRNTNREAHEDEGFGSIGNSFSRSDTFLAIEASAMQDAVNAPITAGISAGQLSYRTDGIRQWQKYVSPSQLLYVPELWAT